MDANLLRTGAVPQDEIQRLPAAANGPSKLPPYSSPHGLTVRRGKKALRPIREKPSRLILTFLLLSSQRQSPRPASRRRGRRSRVGQTTSGDGNVDIEAHLPTISIFCIHNPPKQTPHLTTPNASTKGNFISTTTHFLLSASSIEEVPYLGRRVEDDHAKGVSK